MLMSRRAWSFAAIIAMLGAATPASAANPVSACPDIGSATKLVLVTATEFASQSAQVRLFESRAGKWHQAGAGKKAVLGGGGLAWSWTQERFAGKGEPVKKEGDRKTPAGFFSIAAPFGFAQSERKGYVRLAKGEHYCVDDPASPHYNSIVPKAKAGEGVSGEDMAAIPPYRKGLFLNYPTSREKRGGSCIFVHVWRTPSSPTSGCVALAEADVEDIQSWSANGATAIGIVPEPAWRRLRGCFPGL